jgi:alpha-maltose-1-phosphate synthase
MRVALLTREYPPDVYGGAGVHVEYLARELAQRVELEVHCWGAEREDPAVHAYEPWAVLAGKAPHIAALQAVSIDLLMAAGDHLRSHPRTPTITSSGRGTLCSGEHPTPRGRRASSDRARDARMSRC